MMNAVKVPLSSYSVEDYSKNGLLINIDGVHETLKIILGTKSKCAGFYCFYDKNGYPLYLGKSVDIRTRVKQHLSPCTLPMSRISKIVKYVKVSLVELDVHANRMFPHEAELIKNVKPLFNGAQGGTRRAYLFENLREWLNGASCTLRRMTSNDAERAIIAKISEFVSSDKYSTDFIEDGGIAISEDFAEEVEIESEYNLAHILKAIKYIAKHDDGEVDDILCGLIKVANSL